MASITYPLIDPNYLIVPEVERILQKEYGPNARFTHVAEFNGLISRIRRASINQAEPALVRIRNGRETYEVKMKFRLIVGGEQQVLHLTAIKVSKVSSQIIQDVEKAIESIRQEEKQAIGRIHRKAQEAISCLQDEEIPAEFTLGHNQFMLTPHVMLGLQGNRKREEWASDSHALPFSLLKRGLLAAKNRLNKIKKQKKEKTLDLQFFGSQSKHRAFFVQVHFNVEEKRFYIGSAYFYDSENSQNRVGYSDTQMQAFKNKHYIDLDA